VGLEGQCARDDGKARFSEARILLRETARRGMRARGSHYERDSENALAIWHETVSGLWSLVDHFDSDGRHYLVARRTPPEKRSLRALSAREARVAANLGMGFSNKFIGYRLGLSASAVGDHISAVRRKLGIQSRTELVRLLAAFASPLEGEVPRESPLEGEAYEQAAVARRPAIDGHRFTVAGEELAVLSISDPDPLAWTELTPAERDICRLLLRGLSNPAIAEVRRRAINTIENQVAAIYRKLKINSRSELAALCER